MTCKQPRNIISEKYKSISSTFSRNRIVNRFQSKKIFLQHTIFRKLTSTASPNK